MITMNEEQIDAVLFDRSLLAECLDKNIGKRIDPAEIGRQEREQQLAKLRESLQKAA